MGNITDSREHTRLCLYCSKPADSLEHIFPEGLGGRSPQLILCNEHNREVGNTCDEPLIESLSFFVHVFRIKRKGGEKGIAIRGTDADGKEYIVEADFVPRFGKRVEIIERTPDGRPSKIKATDLEAANKTIKSMNLPLDAVVTFEPGAIPAPHINLGFQFGGAGPFRGILKIAYEFAMTTLDAKVSDSASDAKVRGAILGDSDPMHFVKWLPYDKVPRDVEAEFFSNRIIAWQSGNEILTIVEFFNCLPFVVRLPGLLTPTAALYVQGVQGGNPLVVNVAVNLPWTFDDIPEHAQPEIMRELPAHLGPILETYRLQQLSEPVIKSLGERFLADQNASIETLSQAVLGDLTTQFGRPLASDDEHLARVLIGMAYAELRGLIV